MSIELDLLRYVGLYEEPNGSYAVDHSATPGDFLAFPFMEGTLQAQLAQDDLNPMTGKIRADGDDKVILGPKSCTLAMATALHSHGLDLDGDVAPPTVSTWALMRLLEAIMGGSITTTDESAQTTVQAGSTTTTAVEVTSSHGTRFAVGGVIGCEVVSGSGLIEAREIASIASDVITVKEAFSSAPVTGSAVRGGVTFHMTEDPNTSLQALIEGREGTDGLLLTGLQGGFSLQLPVGGLGQIAFALAGAAWSRLGSSSVTVPSYSVFGPMALNPLEVHVPTIGSTTRVVVEQAEVSIEPQITYAPVRSGAAANTISRMRRQAVRPLVQGSFTIPYEDDTWWTAHSARQDRALFAQCGNVPGSTVLISCPTIQIGLPQPAASAEGIAGQTVPFRGRHDEEIGGSTEVGYSAFRIHCL